jgi:hypothetical protein
VSAKQATNARARDLKILELIKHNEYKGNIYLTEYRSEIISSENALQRMTTMKIQSSSISTSTLPPKLQKATQKTPSLNDRHKLFEYMDPSQYGIHDGDAALFSKKMLDDAEIGIFHPSAPMSHRPSREAAIAYGNELNTHRHPNHDQLSAEAKKIRDSHFY